MALVISGGSEGAAINLFQFFKHLFAVTAFICRHIENAHKYSILPWHLIFTYISMIFPPASVVMPYYPYIGTKQYCLKLSKGRPSYTAVAGQI